MSITAAVKKIWGSFSSFTQKSSIITLEFTGRNFSEKHQRINHCPIFVDVQIGMIIFGYFFAHFCCVRL